MKKLIIMGALLSSSLTYGQGLPLATFERQSGWESLSLRSPELNAELSGFKTTRGSLRMNFDTARFHSPLILEVENKEKWQKTCRNIGSTFNEVTDGLALTIRENPLSNEYSYTLYNAPQGQTYSIYDVENAPKSVTYNLRILENEHSDSMDYHLDGYRAYIKRTQAELNKQFQAQLPNFLANRPVTFDLSKMTDVGCDLTFNLMGVVIDLEIKADLAKVRQYNWIEKKELKALYEELKNKETKNLEIFRAGINIGSVFQKVNPQINLAKNDRDLKFLNSLFNHKKDLFSLKELNEVELEEVFHETPELLMPKTLEQVIESEITMSKLDIVERK